MVYERIRAFIDSKGIKHTAVAHKLGMSKQLFSSKLRGQTNFTADEYIALCHALGVDLNEFDYGSNE